MFSHVSQENNTAFLLTIHAEYRYADSLHYCQLFKHYSVPALSLSLEIIEYDKETGQGISSSVKDKHNSHATQLCKVSCLVKQFKNNILNRPRRVAPCHKSIGSPNGSNEEVLYELK